ncbi:MAG TPA: DMT family protein [Candidatus Brocadiia bacterium]|nr:DMT family protein [Candidatus Brocadiia bacterium]
MTKLLPVFLLVGSNIFMTYAWYGHLKDLRGKPVLIAILVSWGVALLEYCLQVPANRIGHQFYSLGQLKVMQEVITMCVFTGFCVFYMREKLTLDFLWAGLCLVGAAYFMFRHVAATH